MLEWKGGRLCGLSEAMIGLAGTIVTGGVVLGLIVGEGLYLVRGTKLEMQYYISALLACQYFSNLSAEVAVK